MIEYWDLYDKNRQKLNKVVKRGDFLKDNEYHLVVNIWIRNSKNEFLITQRSANKSYAFMWECTGGSAIHGETSKEAAIREVREELGIDIKNSNATLIGTTRRYYTGCPDILDVWLFDFNVEIDKVKIQKEEVNAVMWASTEKIYELYNKKKFEANAFFKEVLNMKTNNVYYIGLNANNAICNDHFFSGSITLYPTNENGNIFFSNKLLKDTKSEKFLKKYHDYIYKNVLEKQKSYPQSYFLCFNEKIRKLCNHMKNINIIKTNDEEILNMLNNKFLTRKLANKYMPILDYYMINNNLSYKEIVNLVGENSFVLQAERGSGGDETYFVTSENNMPILNNNYKYCVSKYIKNLPLNITIIIYKDGVVFLPISVQLIMVINNKFKYVGGDFAYAKTLKKEVISKVNLYSKKLAKNIQKMGYRGILGIDFILKNDIVYFMEINPRFQSSSFLISKSLYKKYNIDIAQLHYNALIGKSKDNIKLGNINNSFLNCNSLENFDCLENYEILTNGYFKFNKNSFYRKIFKRSIIEELDFENEKNL